MKWLCVLRLFSLLSLSITASAAPGQLRATASLLDASRQQGAAQDWDYDDEGASWKTGKCPSGNTLFSQSPVNFSTTVAAVPKDSDFFFFKYPAYEAPVKMINDGRFLYTVFPNGDGKIGGFALGTSFPHHLSVEYDLHKMIIHTPSEHTYNGEKVPLEVQLVHRKKDAEMTDGEPHPRETAIVAVGFAESRDEASPFLRSLIDGGLPDQRGASTLDNRAYPSALKFSELFKPVFGEAGEKAGFWDYEGSLTQPPCSTGVRWFVKQEALNAKKETLDYFTNVVKRASGGVPHNNRALQIMGTRPVFPRMARNAVHMVAYVHDEPAAFKAAYAKIKTHQKAFREAERTDKGGSKAAMKDGKGSTSTVLASNDYKNCMDLLGEIFVNVELAKTKQKDECNKAKGAEKTVASISGGPAKMEAAAKHASMAKSCIDDGKVVQALEAQMGTQESKCTAIKSKVQQKVMDEVTAVKK